MPVRIRPRLMTYGESHYRVIFESTTEMGRRKHGTPPPMLHHKATGQAYSTLAGESVYHGIWDSAASRRAYAAFVAKWSREHGTVAEPAAAGTIAELCDDYRERVACHLSRDEQRAFRVNLASLCEQSGSLSPNEFTPRLLKDLRTTWIEEGNARQTVNKKAGRVRRVFRWALSEERIQPATLTALESVQDLLPGRTEAPDYAEVHPVPLRDLLRTLPHLSVVAQAMVRIQYYVGCRPGEVCRMAVDEFHRGKVSVTVAGSRRTISLPPGVLAFVPSQHKNKSKGKSLVYLIGPRVQAILEPFLASKKHLFSRPPSGKIRRYKTNGQPYREEEYARDIAAAALAAGVEHWSPGMLRHNFASRTDQRDGIEATATALGHLHLSTSAVYIERNLKQAARIALQHG